jgi:hypothetical protein
MIFFIAFVEKDLKDKAISRATPNQPRGIQTIDKKYITGAPDTVPPNTAKQ